MKVLLHSCEQGGDDMSDAMIFLILGLIVPAVLIFCMGVRDEIKKYREHQHHTHGHHKA